MSCGLLVKQALHGDACMNLFILCLSYLFVSNQASIEHQKTCSVLCIVFIIRNLRNICCGFSYSPFCLSIHLSDLTAHPRPDPDHRTPCAHRSSSPRATDVRRPRQTAAFARGCGSYDLLRAQRARAHFIYGVLTCDQYRDESFWFRFPLTIPVL